MEHDRRTCPGCGALSPDHSPCPYCGWTPERSEESHPAESPPDSEGLTQSVEATEEKLMDLDGNEPAHHGDALPPTEDVAPALFHDLMVPDDEPAHLLEQVPEEMRGLLAARLKATEETGDSNLSENTASALRGQGYIISEDARGARFAAASGQSTDLSASDVVKMAAEMDGGVQPQTKLPICSRCQAASPVGETQCQWCGEPFE